MDAVETTALHGGHRDISQFVLVAEHESPGAFVEALCTCVVPLASLQAAASPASLASCGLQPCHVRLIPGDTPQRCRMLVQTVSLRTIYGTSLCQRASAQLSVSDLGSEACLLRLFSSQLRALQELQDHDLYCMA